jgi:hypothetical protein
MSYILYSLENNGALEQFNRRDDVDMRDAKTAAIA